MGRLVVEQTAGEYNRRWTSKFDSLSASHFVGGLFKLKQIKNKYKGLDKDQSGVRLEQ